MKHFPEDEGQPTDTLGLVNGDPADDASASPVPDKRPPRVFLSYAHDDAAFSDLVRRFYEFLRIDRGIDAVFDRVAAESPQEWTTWMIRQWMEMRLRVAGAQSVRLRALDLAVEFDDGEELRTEISAKFRRRGLASELRAAGLKMTRWWTDPAADFAVSLSVPA